MKFKVWREYEMKGKRILRLESTKIYKTKKNANKYFIARIIQIPKDGDRLDFVLEIQNLRTKKICYNEILVSVENWYNSFRLVRGNMEWVSLYTVVVWDRLGHKLVEVSALTGKESYRIGDEHCSTYRDEY